MRRLILQRTFLDRTRSLLAWRCRRIKNHLKGSRQFFSLQLSVETYRRVGIRPNAVSQIRCLPAS